MDVAVHHHTARFDIGDVEEMLVGAARETNRQDLAETRVRTVATDDERSVAVFEASIWMPQLHDDSILALLTLDQLRLTFDGHIAVAQCVNEQPLMLVLGEDERV